MLSNGPDVCARASLARSNAADGQTRRMKWVDMAERKDKTVPDVRDKPRKKTDAAFDLWLQRGLHKLYDNVANEPVPEALLRLIEEDRKK